MECKIRYYAVNLSTATNNRSIKQGNLITDTISTMWNMQSRTHCNGFIKTNINLFLNEKM